MMSKGVRNYLQIEKNNFKPVNSEFPVSSTQFVIERDKQLLKDCLEQQDRDRRAIVQQDEKIRRENAKRIAPHNPPTLGNSVSLPIKEIRIFGDGYETPNGKILSKHSDLHASEKVYSQLFSSNEDDLSLSNTDNFCDFTPTSGNNVNDSDGTVASDMRDSSDSEDDRQSFMNFDQLATVPQLHYKRVDDVDKTNTSSVASDLLDIGYGHLARSEEVYEQLFLDLTKFMVKLDSVEAGEATTVLMNDIFNELYTASYTATLKSSEFVIGGVRVFPPVGLNKTQKARYVALKRVMKSNAVKKVNEVRVMLNEILLLKSDQTNKDSLCLHTRYGQSVAILKAFLWKRNYCSAKLASMSLACDPKYALYNSDGTSFHARSMKQKENMLTPTAASSSPSPSPPPSFTTAVATPTTPPQQSTVPETSQITIPPCVVVSGSKVALDLVERRESSRIKSNQAAKTSTLATTASSQPPNKGKKRKKSCTAKRRGTTEIGARVESDDDDDDDDEESLSSGDSSSDDSSDGSGDDHDDHADDDGDVTIGMSEEALMAHCKDLMCNPDFLGDEYIQSRDFNKNSPPADFIKGDDKHYVFPFLFCDPSGRARKKMPKHCEQDLEYVKSSALCRYINKLCGEVIARQKVKAEFVTKRGTTEDVNKIFKPIRNNIMHKREDGKRQFTIIDLTEPENLEFKNFLINVKNLMIKTGAVPADCFPTSDGGDDQITLIVQLGRAMQQHFHFDFNPELYKPHRNRRRQKRMQYKEFNGLSMFLNPSWVEQTLDLPDIDHTTKSHKQLYNTPISLMLMNGNQAHAGSPNDTDEDIWKFFWYVRPSDYVEDDETFLFYSSTCEYFPIAQAINERNHRVSLIEK